MTKERQSSGISQTTTKDYDRSEDEARPIIHDGSTEQGIAKTARWIRERTMKERRNAQGWE